MIRPDDSDLKMYEFAPILISGRRFSRKSSSAEMILMLLGKLYDEAGIQKGSKFHGLR